MQNRPTQEARSPGRPLTLAGCLWILLRYNDAEASRYLLTAVDPGDPWRSKR
jgi:hypothetical protein